MRLQSSIVSFLFLTLFLLSGAARAQGKIDRGLTAVERDRGRVFISWRQLAEDNEKTTYHISKRVGPDGKFEPLTKDKPLGVTNYEDTQTHEKGARVSYRLFVAAGEKRRRSAGECSVAIAGQARPWIEFPLAGDYDFQKVAVADLDGDGAFEYVIKQPNFNTDPYQQPGYWKKSTTTYKLEAYEQDGTLLWRHDMGWSIEAGIWYSPWVVYDIDGDGKAEVYCKGGEGDPRDEKGLVQSGPEYLLKLDGETGKVLKKIDWFSRDGYGSYNYYCRNFLAVAYLDGKTPSLVMQRGTYKLIRMQALDKNLNQIWYWDTTKEEKTYGGQSAHNLTAADVDGDGRDEIVMGAAVIDDDGKGLWTLEMGHPDFAYVGDVDPTLPGLEIAYGFEKRLEKNGICLVEAKTGKMLWGHGEPTYHVHSQGMAADVLADYPGMEIFGGERDFERRWLYSAKGELIEFHEKGALAPRALWWDGDANKEVAPGRAIHDLKGPKSERLKLNKNLEGMEGEAIQGLEGKQVLVVDCLGDWREEIVMALKGKMRIYTTSIPTERSRPALMLNRQYRLGITGQTSGYYCPAQLDTGL